MHVMYIVYNKKIPNTKQFLNPHETRNYNTYNIYIYI